MVNQNNVIYALNQWFHDKQIIDSLQKTLSNFLISNNFNSYKKYIITTMNITIQKYILENYNIKLTKKQEEQYFELRNLMGLKQ